MACREIRETTMSPRVHSPSDLQQLYETRFNDNSGYVGREATCSEAEHQLAAGLSEREVEIFLDAAVAMAEPVKTHFLWRPQLRDPGDEMVLETAVNGRADALVTFNVRDFQTVPAWFGIEVMIPREAIRRMRR